MDIYTYIYNHSYIYIYTLVMQHGLLGNKSCSNGKKHRTKWAIFHCHISHTLHVLFHHSHEPLPFTDYKRSHILFYPYIPIISPLYPKCIPKTYSIQIIHSYTFNIYIYINTHMPKHPYIYTGRLLYIYICIFVYIHMYYCCTT